MNKRDEAIQRSLRGQRRDVDLGLVSPEVYRMRLDMTRRLRPTVVITDDMELPPSTP